MTERAANGPGEIEEAGLEIALVLASSTGGIGRHVRSLARAFASAGHRVFIYGPAATNLRFGFAEAGEECRPAFDAVEIGARPSPTATWRAVRQLRQRVRCADVVHAHGLRAGVVAALASARWRSGARQGAHRPALVVTFHNAALGSRLRRACVGYLERRLASASDAVLAVSPDLLAALRPARPDAGRALVSSRLPLPARARPEVRAEFGLTDGQPAVLALGRLHPQKGFDVLIEAAAVLGPRLAARSSRLRPVFLVAGEGPARRELEERIGSTRQRSDIDVRLLGDRSADVADLVEAADVVVMPSRWEGWPLAAAEVIGAGKPLVATAVGGLPELVGDAGVLVRPEDPDALATALAEVLTDAELASRLASRAGERAAQLPTDAAVAASVLATYRAVVRPPADSHAGHR